MNIVNITAYRFVHLPEAELPALQQQLITRGNELGVKGTIYLSTEGINFSAAGERAPIEEYKKLLASISYFENLHYKESLSETIPFSKMKVKVKREIIRMDQDSVLPEKHSVPHISPQELKRWYEEKRNMIVLDTRNNYEYEAGTFENAINPNIENFRDFPAAVDKLPEEYKEKPIVMFCTGGVRCEKAGEYMHQKGFKEVYQLDGGIINYFIETGSAHWQGDCFVFDDRVTINTKLEETRSKHCPHCRDLPAKAAVGCEYCRGTVGAN